MTDSENFVNDDKELSWEDFIASGDSRNTSKEVMEAIARLAVNMAEAELIWANGYSENVSEQDVIDEATDDGRLDPSGLFWGDNTLDKIKLGA